MLSVDSPGDLDICFATLLKQQSAHVQIITEVTPFRPYEDFAGTCAERSRKTLDTTPIESVTKEGLYYFIWSRVEYLGNHGNAKYLRFNTTKKPLHTSLNTLSYHASFCNHKFGVKCPTRRKGRNKKVFLLTDSMFQKKKKTFYLSWSFGNIHARP